MNQRSTSTVYVLYKLYCTYYKFKVNKVFNLIYKELIKYVFGLPIQLKKSAMTSGYVTVYISTGVVEASRQGGLCPTQILAEQKAPPGSGGALHYYLPSQIFRPYAIPEVYKVRMCKQKYSI